MIPGSKKSAFTLHDVFLYIAIASKHVRLMVLLICAALTAGLTFYVFAKPVYFGHAVVHVDYLSRPLDTDEVYKESNRFGGFMVQFTDPHILLRTARALGVDTNDREFEKKYMFKLRTSLDSQQDIDVQVWPFSPDWARRWTETMVQEFNADRLEKRIEDRNKLISAYSDELREVVARFDQQFSEKMDFQDQQDFTRMLILVNSISNLPTELSRIQMRIDELGRVRVRLQDPTLGVVAKLSLIASTDDELTRLSVGQVVAQPQKAEAEQKNDKANVTYQVVGPGLLKSEHPWDLLVQEQQHIETQMQEAGKLFLPGHKKMVEFQKQLDSVDERLDAELQVATKRFDLEYQELLNKKHDLEAKLPEYQELTRKHTKLLSQLSIFDMSRVPFDKYVGDIKRRMDEVDFGGERETVTFKYAGLIEARDEPVSPNRLHIVLLSLGLGVALAIGVPYLIEYLDHTISNMEEVERSLRLRGLGIVPQMEATESFLSLEPGDSAPKSGLVENFRVIRTNVLSMGAMTKQPHVIMVTSAMPKEGKTVIASNLAGSFAITGAKTLLIDTDLRRGRLHRIFGHRKEPGLSNVLIGESTLEEALISGGHENLTVLSAGRHIEHGTELLASTAFTTLLSQLRDRFERIVIDTPPVLGLSETSIMQNYVDGVLFVIWTGHTPVRGVHAAIEALRSNGANFYGFVLNRLDLNATQNYYQYYYYSYDYYYQHVETT